MYRLSAIGQVRRLSTVLLAAFLVIGISSATTCVEVKYSFKPLSRACGMVMDQAGDPIEHAKVRISKGDTLVAQVQTDSVGWFSFDTLADGDYDIRFFAEGFTRCSFPIVVHKTHWKPHRSLEAVLPIATGPCGCSAALNRSWTDRLFHWF